MEEEEKKEVKISLTSTVLIFLIVVLLVFYGWVDLYKRIRRSQSVVVSDNYKTVQQLNNK